MISQAPQLRIKNNTPIGNELFFKLPDLSQNNASFLESDFAAGVTVITANSTPFVVGQYLLIGQPGQQKSEIVKIQSMSVNTITLTTATQFAHSRGDVITFIEYNQLLAERSTNGGTSFTPLTAIDIQPQFPETVLFRTADTATDVYKYRFFNVTTGLYSAYSDVAIASGFPDNSVYAIKRRSLSQLGEVLSDLVTNDFLNDTLAEARRVVDMGTAVVDGVPQRVLRWSFRSKKDAIIGSAVAGQYRIPVPADLRDQDTNKNIRSIRIGRQNWNVTFQDLVRFNQNYLNVAHSTLLSSIAIAATTIPLVASGDFDPAATIYIAGQNVNGVRDAVNYTGNNMLTNTLSGATGVAVAAAAGTDVWQNATFGRPTYYTIIDGYIYFDVPFDDNTAGENIYMDYYAAISPVTSDAAILDEPFYDLYVSYLKYKIKSLKSNGALDPTQDGDYKLFLQGFGALVSQEILGQPIRFVPTSGDWGTDIRSYF